MSVTVANTTASLSGKTLLKAEDSQTITGQKTFDVGAAAPFVCVSGSAKVDHLDADKLDGAEGSAYHDAAQLTGTYAALDGSAITSLAASNLSSGNVPAARNTKTLITTPVDLTDGATPALDASLGKVFELIAAGNRTIAVPTNPTAGQAIIIKHKASGADRTLSLNAGAGGFRFGTDITALTATTSGKWDYIGCIYNDDDSKWDVVAYVKGY